MAALEAQMNEQEEEANAAIAQWQESCSKLQDKNSELISALEAVAADKEAVSQEVYSSVQTQLKATEAALADATARAQALETQLTEREASMAEWQVTCASLEGKNEELLGSLDAMRSELADTKKILSEIEIKIGEADGMSGSRSVHVVVLRSCSNNSHSSVYHCYVRTRCWFRGDRSRLGTAAHRKRCGS